MFQTVKQKLILGSFIFLILFIPIGSYLVSSRQQTQVGKASTKDRSITNLPQPSPKNGVEELKKMSEPKIIPIPSPSPQVSVSFGPTLDFKVVLEGRPAQNQATKLFLGIVSGQVSTKLKYLLSFQIDLPASGIFSGLSLAGLEAGSSYFAILKGPVQIATSSSFVMSPSVTNLNSGQPLPLLSGDLNEDNTINSADFAIASSSFGASKQSGNWNENIDFNKDGVINSLDLSLIIKNFGKIGAGGVWISPPPPATRSGSLTPLGSSEGLPANRQGYWLWMPGF